MYTALYTLIIILTIYFGLRLTGMLMIVIGIIIQNTKFDRVMKK